MTWPLVVSDAAIASAAQQFPLATPFPHLVLDDWFDEEALQDVAALFDVAGAWQSYEDGKRATVSVKTHPFFQAMNSPAFVRVLEQLGGEPLVIDPTLRGGGLHAVRPGGRLGIHVDFNRHPTLPLARRLNTILYLNQAWVDGWHGHLTLTDRRGCDRVIAPRWNRWVLFRYGPESWHGHPEPLACPPDVERRSVAMYYYQPLDDQAVPFTGTQYA